MAQVNPTLEKDFNKIVNAEAEDKVSETSFTLDEFEKLMKDEIAADIKNRTNLCLEGCNLHADEPDSAEGAVNDNEAAYNTADRCYCFLVAPSLVGVAIPNTEEELEEYQAKLKIDKEAREIHCKQYTEVMSEVLRLDSSNTFIQVVTRYSELKDVLGNFLHSSDSDAHMAVIIFNGHGTKEGLVVEKDGSVPLETFMTDVTELLDKVRITNNENKTEPLPYRIKVIFAQCFGHLVKAPKREDIKVVPLSSAEHGETTVYTIKIIDGKLDTSHHYDLGGQANEEKDKVILTDPNLSA